MGEVYEALALSDPTQRFAIKFIRSKGKHSFEHLHRFHQEATLLSQLYHPHITSLREFGVTRSDQVNTKKSGSFYYIVMDYVQGISLQEIIRSNGAGGLNLQFFFQVACQIASALDYTHGKNIIHRDVKPHNIMVEKTSGGTSGVHAQLLDYGVATLGEVTNYIGGDQTSPLDRVVGTPLYMAPEISSTKQEGCDHRLDLYSLGCVLYQVLRGRPPFMSNSIVTLKHLHATEQPESLLKTRRDLPKVVDRIIMKLLAKNPDDRYQTAFSLTSDLLNIKKYTFTPMLVRSQHHGMISDLGLNSYFRSLKRKLKLIGRTKELHALIKFYSHVATNGSRGHISLVCGANGSGKSRLLSELKDYFVARKVKFISSLFIKYNAQSSLQCLASGFDEYLLKVIRHQPYEAKNIKKRLKQVIGDRIDLLTDIIPSTQLFMDEGSQQENLNDHSEQINISLLSKTFTDFTRCLISFDQPIVFIFDDVDFADKASLQIIDDFFNLNNSEQIYIVLSCHDGTHGPLKPHVEQFLIKIAKFRRRYQKIILNPLTLQQTSKLVCQLLNVRYSGILPIASYLFGQYKGNLLYTIEKLRDLALHGELSHNLKNKHWSYDINMVQNACRPLGEVDLFLTRIASFDQDTINIIEAAAVYGMNFDTKILSITKVSSHQKLNQILDHLEHESVIAKVYDCQYSYRFVHSHYRDVVLYYLDKDRKTGIHLATAIELSNKKVIRDEKLIFAITHHFKEGFRRKNPYVSITTTTVSRAFYYAVKAGQIAKAQKTRQCSIVFYQFAVGIMNNYLKSQQMNHGDRERVYFEYITLLLRERFYQKAIRILTEIFQTGWPIYHQNQYIDIVRENLLECYLKLLLRISDFETIKALTTHYLKQIGIVIHEDHDGPSFRKGLSYDKVYYVNTLNTTTKSPTHSLLRTLNTTTKTARPRSIMLLNFLYQSLDPNSYRAQLCHKIAMDVAGKRYSKKQDLIKLFHKRLDVIRTYHHTHALQRIVTEAAAVIKKLNSPRCEALFQLHLACDMKFAKHHNYNDIRDFVLHKKRRYCYSLHDFNEMGHLHAANLTRLFLEEKVMDINQFLPVIRRHFSTRSPHFPYILMVLTHYYAYNHNRDKIDQIIMKVISHERFSDTHNKVIFFHMSQAFALLYSDKFEESAQAFVTSIKILASDHQLSLYPAYQVDFLIFSMMAYPYYFEALAQKSLPFKQPYKILRATCMSRFSSSHSLYVAIHGIEQLSHNKRLSKKNRAKIFSKWEHVCGELAIAGLKTTRIFLTTLLSRWQYAILDKEFAAVSLLKTLRETRMKRFIGMTLIVENILTDQKIAFKKREQRTDIQPSPSIFDHMISNLYVVWLDYFSRPQFLELPLKNQFQIAFHLFQDKFGAEDGYLVHCLDDNTIECDGVFSSSKLPDELIPEIKARTGSDHVEIFSLINIRRPSVQADETHLQKEETKPIAKPSQISDDTPPAHEPPLPLPVSKHCKIHENTQQFQHPTILEAPFINNRSGSATHSLYDHEHLLSITGCLIPLRINKQPHIYLYIHHLGHQYRLNPEKACQEILMWGQLLGRIIEDLKNDTSYQLIPFRPAHVHLPHCKWSHFNLVQNPRYQHQALSPTSWIIGHELKSYQYFVFHLNIKSHPAKKKSMRKIHHVSKMIWHHVQLTINDRRFGIDQPPLEQIKNDMVYLIKKYDTQNSEIESISGFLALIGQQHSQVYLLNDSVAFTTTQQAKEHLSQPIVLHRLHSQGSLLYRKYLAPTSDQSHLMIVSSEKPTKGRSLKAPDFNNNPQWHQTPAHKRAEYLNQFLPRTFPHSTIMVISPNTSSASHSKHPAPPSLSAAS